VVNNKILVTGGTGYIGSHTVVELIYQGFEPLIIDNLDNSNISVLDGIEKITGQRPSFQELDLLDEAGLNSFFQHNKGIKAVIHFAAHKAVGESVQNPLKYYRNNVSGLINLLREMQKNNISHLVFSSSCTVYGQPDQLPVTEVTPVMPAMSPYGNTKQIGEEVIRDLCNSSSLRSVALRYFNPVGAHQSALIGELPIGVPNNLVPFITQSAAGIIGPLKIFGKDYNTPDGTCIRDYIHVSDVADAHIFAMHRMLNEKQSSKFEVFNIGTGKGTSVLEAVLMFEEISGIKLHYSFVDRRSGDVEKVYADTQLANKELGWKAQRDLREMLRSAWLWQQKLIAGENA
jgi:UDP-glucose 4-epimerase